MEVQCSALEAEGEETVRVSEWTKGLSDWRSFEELEAEGRAEEESRRVQRRGEERRGN